LFIGGCGRASTIDVEKMKILKIIGNVLYGIVIGLLVFVVVTSFLSFAKNPIGLRTYVVQSGSMEPTIKVGSLVFVKAKTNYNKEDIITFFTNLESPKMDYKVTTTHRIVDVTQTNGKNYYQTKGDANNAPDRSSVPENYVIGKVMLIIPLVGYLLAFVRTQLGFILLVIIPATIIVYEEIQNIKKELRKLIIKRNLKKNSDVAVVNIAEVTKTVVEVSPQPETKPKPRVRKTKSAITK
jgi:signal peptidase I